MKFLILLYRLNLIFVGVGLLQLIPLWFEEHPVCFENPEQLANELILQVKIVAKRGGKEDKQSHHDGVYALKRARAMAEAHRVSLPELLSQEDEKGEHTREQAGHEHKNARV